MADHIAAMEAQMVSERMRRKLSEVNSAAQAQLSPVQDHINFTLQQAYFKCAHECFDRRRKQEEISNCVEHCSVPVLNAQNHFENEMAKFQERLNRSLMVCQDRFEAAKAQQLGSDAVNALESCVDQSIQDNMKTLPHLVGRMKQSLAISGEAK
ncbi:PREDICTED: protein FAM136A-like [Populus euphratica]|uniref:Protein FAM136A-like n=1 Tax=Populus euphratica TaxID=75702 RepID=A0AAJ6UY36_POPEU|nr:PREDICTED: protein FAM136A-like [Populus euphratica]